MTNPNNAYQPNQNSYGGQPGEANPFASPSGSQYGSNPAPYGGQQGQNLPAQQYGYQQNYGQQPVGEQKSWIAALLFAFFLGGTGAHNFYLGRKARGGWQLGILIFSILTSWILIGAVTAIGLSIWAFVEFIMIVAGAGGYDKDARGIPLKK